MKHFLPFIHATLFSALLSISLSGLCAAGRDTLHQSEQQNTVVANGASIHLIAKKFAFTEGPTADRVGNVYFTDQPNDQIWKYGIDGQLSLFMEKTGRSNGMYFDKKGNLISCADERNEIWSIDPNKKTTVILSDLNGQLFNGPNDLWVHPKGGIYFTDPLYPRTWWKRGGERIAGERVYFLPKNKKTPLVVDSTIKKPNGITGSADGKTLYVADIGGNKTYTYKIEKNGLLTNRMVFAEQGSDGMTTDNEGNIYLTGNGVTVYDKTGKKIEHIAVPEKWTANVCFGGKNKDELFITASEAVYTIQMKVKGVGSK